MEAYAYISKCSKAITIRSTWYPRLSRTPSRRKLEKLDQLGRRWNEKNRPRVSLAIVQRSQYRVPLVIVGQLSNGRTAGAPPALSAAIRRVLRRSAGAPPLPG